MDLLTEPASLLPFTVNGLSLPRYFNASCWRLAESETKLVAPEKEGVSWQGLEGAWLTLRRVCGSALLYEPIKEDGASATDSRIDEQIIGDIETVAFYAAMDPSRLQTCDGKRLRRRSKPESADWLGWADLELVVNGWFE